MKKSVFVNMLLIAMTALLAPGSAVPADAKIPMFIPEPVSTFAAVLQGQRRTMLDIEHTSGVRYHAYRYLDPTMVLIGVASNIFVDGNGRVHVVQAHGQPMGGHLNPTHQEYSHVLLPIGVNPP